MKLITLIAVSTSVVSALEWLPVVPLHARQLTSGPKYDCHADCGYAILDAKQGNYCTNETWTGFLQDCLECAEQYDIWQYYGDGVTEAAEGCNLDATPVSASNSTSNATATTGTSATGSTTSPTATGTAASTDESSAANLNRPAIVVFSAAILVAAHLL
ncbi:hypothetical protein CkaCkLH20_08168 [Colletotrichum karsti]|uniref:Uncharacterized protein n=1 Tax=Colletotrichum karsti TaxID=1095194 RepID=A0A9P6LIW0_9PEZI|nr:uncharacterized protein CkaCkLH20_08168 [Colletotrichum karsti]KAF9874185.1 hypothetical protein CkaCkLH20_08168 [Colletotrichum karsti]